MLVESGWRFFDSENGPANIQLELNVKITDNFINNLGEDFENVKNGFVDYLLLDEKQSPLVIVEAKKSDKHPLDGKEQARQYALNLRAKYVILSNGVIHYFWNISKGNPEVITVFPTLDSLENSRALNATTKFFISETFDEYYIAKSQDLGLEHSSVWKSGDKGQINQYCKANNLKILRDYQIQAIQSIQNAVKDNKTRFLLEMATGTGKTLTSAAVIKLFIRSEIANRILFFVDRLELENQALKDLRRYLSKDGIKVLVYKENKDDWTSADVVISTIQSFSFNNKYQRLFSPSSFDLVISDESHRSLGSSNRAIFEYFIGYKLGLTATPKNYLKGVDFDVNDPREIEKRVLLDTYQIFGCDSGTATFSYTLMDGVKNGYLVSPIIVDARSDITAQLLSDEGYTLKIDNDESDFNSRDNSEMKFDITFFEKKFFSEDTNRVLCQTFILNALRDPISNELGKSILFCVNISHARKITAILNELAEVYFPNKYNSDFAIQITSNIEDSQQMTINFSNNNLNGKTKWMDDYESSKSRVAVTVGMMTTGYDCSDLMNLGFLRPIFSPTDFIQMKGRGTRKFDFKHDNLTVEKETFKIFDFFAVCEYFESEFDYDEKISLPINTNRSGRPIEESRALKLETFVYSDKDNLLKYSEDLVGIDGMKIDRKFYQSFKERILNDTKAQTIINKGDEDLLEHYIRNNVLDLPSEYFSIRKLERSLDLDRRLSIKELVQFLLGNIGYFKSRSELIEDELNNFKLLNQKELLPYAEIITSIDYLIEAYLSDPAIRKAVKERNYQVLINSPLAVEVRATKDVKIKGDRLFEYLHEYVIVNGINCEIYSD